MWQTNGFLMGDVDLTRSLELLFTYLDEVPALYRKYTDEQLLYKPGPAKWSKKEILGHLIDSAINNLQRFTEIQFLPSPYIVESYRQEDLVLVNRYQELPIEHLLVLWTSLNRQIIYVAESLSPDTLSKEVNPQYINNEMKSLGWIIGDYVAHLSHHLKQVK